MQAGHDMIASASTSLSQKAASLRQFSRFGAVALGIIAGVSGAASATSKKEAALKAAIAKRDEKIAEISKELEAIKAPVKDAEKPSSGEPVQDWVDCLGK